MVLLGLNTKKGGGEFSIVGKERNRLLFISGFLFLYISSLSLVLSILAFVVI